MSTKFDGNKIALTFYHSIPEDELKTCKKPCFSRVFDAFPLLFSWILASQRERFGGLDKLIRADQQDGKKNMDRGERAKS